MRHFIETSASGDCEARHELGNFVAVAPTPIDPSNVMHEIGPPAWGAGWPAVGSEYLPTGTSVLTFANGAFGSRETDDLPKAQAKAWERVKASRDAAEASDFIVNGVAYQPDVLRITGAALNALLAQLAGVPFSIDWTVSDDSVVTLNGAQMQGVGIALAQHINSVHAIGRTLRAQIAAAQTHAEVGAVTWPA